jgi:phosphoglycolate phosphatase
MDLTNNKKAFLDLKNHLPKGIIFDWDNTLVDTWPLIQYAIDKTMVEMGRQPWGITKVKDEIHKSMRESFPEIFGDDWQKAGEIYKDSYRSVNLNQMKFLPGSLNLFDKLEEKGILQFIVSNKIGATLRAEAKVLDVEKKFFAIIGSQDANYDKPSKDLAELALMGSDLDVKKDEIWFIGDSLADVECAYNLGARPIIYGHSDHKISKTIPEKLIINGKNNEGAIPVYFNHQELIELFN